MSNADRYYEPYKGKDFKKSGILILSESAYDWIGEDQKPYSPKKTHPAEGIDWAIAEEHFGRRGLNYFNAITRALCDKRDPTLKERRSAWARVAYSIYIQNRLESVRSRPNTADWNHAKPHFMPLLEELRPKKVIITGLEVWGHMLDCKAEHHFMDLLQAFELKDSTLVWCLAVPHPRSTVPKFRWAEVAKTINLFDKISFPTKV